MSPGTKAVNAYLSRLDHPLRAEIEALRSIILNADPKVAERVRWNRPGFYYKDNLAAFNLRERGFVELVFSFQHGMMIEDRMELLEGDSKDRRMARFVGLDDIEAKKEALECVVRLWVEKKDEMEAIGSGIPGGRRRERWSRLAWMVGMLGGLAVIVQGLAASLKDDPFYRNYWGGVLYGPLTVALGVLILILVPFFELRSRKAQREPKPRGRATRRARKADPEPQHRDPIDDFDRPWGGRP